MKRIKFEKTLSKVLLVVRMAARKFDYIPSIHYFSDTHILVNLFEGQAHLQS